MADTEEEDFDEGYSDLEKELLSHSGNYYDDYGNVVLKVIDPISENGDFSAYILTTRFQMNWNVNKDEEDVTDEKDKKAYCGYYNFIAGNGNGHQNFCGGNKERCKCRC